MGKYKRLVLTVILAAVFMSGCGEKGPAESTPVQSGQENPDTSSQEEEAVPVVFEAMDLEGNEVSSDVFSETKLTMINVWGTFCGPCLREMPDLGALHQEFSEQGFQILGIVTDVQAPDGSISQEQVDLAAQIAEETGASYLHLLPSEDLIACLLWQVSSVPTTIFVDETGALIGKGYLGSRDAAAWRSIIEEKLEAVSAGEDAK